MEPRPAVTAADQRRRFEAIIRADPGLMRLLAVLRELALPQWRLVAGCLYQTVWNVLTGRPRGTGINDYDVIYFDDRDLSWDAEDAVIRRVAVAAEGAVGPVEVRNQARVHLWFEQRFAAPYPPLAAADEAIACYASIAHAVGVRLEPDDRLDLVATFGDRAQALATQWDDAMASLGFTRPHDALRALIRRFLDAQW